MKDIRREYEQVKARIAAIDKIIQRLYKDNVVGKISDERSIKMSATYETEQKQLEDRVTQLQDFIDTTKQKPLNAEYFLSLVRRYTDIKELDAETIREFVEKVIVLRPKRSMDAKCSVFRLFTTVSEQLKFRKYEKTA